MYHPSLHATALLVSTLPLLACGSKSALSLPSDSVLRVDGGAPEVLEPPDQCMELPFEGPPRQLSVSFVARIQSADILFLVDTTGSMTEEIGRISQTLQDQLVPELAETVGDVQFSVASFADFPVSTYGDSQDRPFLLLQSSTSDIEEVADAIRRLPMSDGQDGPESQVEALYQAATGLGNRDFSPGLEPSACPGGRVGYPCFRPEGSPIILLFTDAEFHNGPRGRRPYSESDLPNAASYDDAVAALQGIGAKVLGLFSGDGDAAALEDLETLVADTGALTPEGEPIVFDIGADGRRLGSGVVSAAETLVEEVPINIDVAIEDVEGDEVGDATLLVQEVIASHADPEAGATVSGDRFADVRPGTEVTFLIRLANELFPPGPEPQRFRLRVVLRGDGVTRLMTTNVEIVIPSITGEGC